MKAKKAGLSLFFLLAVAAAGAQTLVPNFTANITSGCGPLTVTFTDQTAGNPIRWNWEFSNGTLSNVQNPAVTFTTPGIYTVKLVVQSASEIGQIEKIDYITVFPSPAADFSANNTLACLPATVNFTDLSTTPVGTIASWSWDFGDGSTSTLQNPVHVYNNVGFYTVTLSVTSSTGCKTTISKGSYIRVLGNVSTDFAFTLSTQCSPPVTATFQNQSNGPGTISYNWDFGNGQTSTLANPTTVYPSPGTYTVQLQAISNLGCNGTSSHTITVTSTTTDFNGPSNICLNQPVVFQNSSSAAPLTASWNFGDGTQSAQINPVKTFLVPGTYNIRLINQYANCIDSVTKTVIVNSKPLVNFAVNDSNSCQAPFTVQFTDLTPGATAWSWDFGDGTTSTQQNPSHQYNSLGAYTVSLTVTTSSGCSNTLVKTGFIQVQDVHISLNTPDGGCVPFTFTPQATIQTVDSIATYAWDLGAPGGLFNVANPPPFTYTAAGIYDISLTVTTVSGCTKTITAPGGIQVGTRPIVNFSATPVNACASDTVNFTDLSITTPGANIGWNWVFGDGSGSNMQNPQHVFIDTGSLHVILYVSNNRCRDSMMQILPVRPPVARFIYTIACGSNQVTFTDTSLIDPGLTPLTYLWEMGDPANTQFTVKNPPPFSYPGPGTYTVSLTVTNGTCSYTTRQAITVANEVADFSISRNPVCKGELFTLTAINSNAANLASYTWTVGGVMLATGGRVATHSIANAGTYDVSLTVRDVNGCVNTKTITNYLAVNGPTAGFSISNPGACLNKTTVFNDLSTPAGGISSWQFDFGDGTQQNFSSTPLTHVYNQTGVFDVKLTVSDVAGCTDVFQLPLSLLVTNPLAGFRADTFYCPGAALQFTDSSSGAGLSYTWNFGDGATSNLSNPQHAYPLVDADYTVKLNVRDIAGCEDSVTKISYIHIRKPKAAFAIQDTTTICPPLRTIFTFQGSDYQSFFWSFGDGGLSTLQNPSYFYSTYGTFTPTLYLQGPGGCMDSAKSSVVIHNPNTSQIIESLPTTACNTLNVDFQLILPPGYKFYFHFGDGQIDSSRATQFSHFYSRPGFNITALVIMDTVAGCAAAVYGTQINVLGAIPLFGMNKDQFCDSSSVIFTNFTTKNDPITSTVWDFGDGQTTSVLDPTHVFNVPGTYLVKLTVNTQSNCSSTYTDTVFVYRTPQPSINGKDTVCLQATELYLGSLAFADTLTFWKWTFDNSGGPTQQNNPFSFSTVGNHTLQLMATNKIGCSNQVTKTVYVSPPPTATPAQDPFTILVGTGANLNMTYTGNITNYAWTPPATLSCANCATPFAAPKFNTDYRVTVTDRYGCVATGNARVVVLCNNQNFFIPNTFSPNGDGQNEIFYPRGTGLFTIRSMLVFDRLGEVVFERKNFKPNDPGFGWNGQFKGQKASADVYVYMIEIQCDNNTIIPVKGNVTLLR